MGMLFLDWRESREGNVQYVRDFQQENIMVLG